MELHQLRTVPKDPTKYIPIKANPLELLGLLTFHEEDDDDFGRPSSVLLDVAIARVLESSGVWRLGGLVRISNFKEEGGPVGPGSIAGSTIELFWMGFSDPTFWL